MTSRKEQEYEAKLLQWRAEKYESRVGENGWLALDGLYWLHEGRNLLGSNPLCEVVLPERAPTFLGVVHREGKTTRFTAAEGVRVKVNGKSAQKAVLKSTKEAKPSFITWNDDLRLVLHFHMDKPAIRIWDNQRPQRFSLPPSKWFPINRNFRLPAKYTRHSSTQQAQSTDTFGDLVEDRMDGYIAFKYQDVQYRLGVTETEDHTLFVKFRDQTSGRETYPPSRYLYTEPVGKSGKLTLDFNFSYSPPCAFTEFATCTFAPPENNLPFRVEAGEIYR